MKKAIIIGATSGIGQEVAKCLLLEGWKIGVAGRRQSSLENLQRAAPDQIQIQALDVTQEDASEKLNLLIDKLGGMDLFLLSSGIGFQNMDLNMEVELNTAHTNVAGFIRMVDTAFMYFKKNGGGHLAVISSIAGTKGLGVAPAYSATKRFQNTYIDALEQLSYLQKLHIRFTDLRPGRKALSTADGCRRSGPSYLLVAEAQTTGSSNRLALPDSGVFLENDSPLDVETPAGKNKLTPKVNKPGNEQVISKIG